MADVDYRRLMAGLVFPSANDRKSWHSTLRHRWNSVSTRTCPYCSLQWSSLVRNGVRQHCFDEACESEHIRRARRKWRSGKSAQSRAKKHGAERRYFDVAQVLARDRWTCQLCGAKTPERLRGTTDRFAPEIDHIVPISKGGGHTKENTQCACRQCNSTKGSKPLGQTLLFG